MLLLGARVRYAFPLSLSVYGGCSIFVWLSVEVLKNKQLFSENRYLIHYFKTGVVVIHCRCVKIKSGIK